MTEIRFLLFVAPRGVEFSSVKLQRIPIQKGWTGCDL